VETGAVFYSRPGVAKPAAPLIFIRQSFLGRGGISSTRAENLLPKSGKFKKLIVEAVKIGIFLFPMQLLYMKRFSVDIVCTDTSGMNWRRRGFDGGGPRPR